MRFGLLLPSVQHRKERGHPLKGSGQEQKLLPRRKMFFSPRRLLTAKAILSGTDAHETDRLSSATGSFLPLSNSRQHFYRSRSFFGFDVSSSLHQSPIRIKVASTHMCQRALPARRRARKSSVPCHVQKILQVSWLLTTL